MATTDDVPPLPPPRGSVHVTAGLVVRGRSVLVARRVRPAHLRGLWEFPGGKVESGEAPAAALRRELLEELGLDVQVGAFVARSAEGAVVLDGYRCEALAGAAEAQPRPLDGTHDAVRWVAAAELRALLAEGALPPLDIPLAERFLMRFPG